MSFTQEKMCINYNVNSVATYKKYMYNKNINRRWRDLFVYKIDVLEALKEAGYNTTRLRKEKLLGENAIQSLRRGEVVGIIALEKICKLLNMQPGNVIQYVDDSKKH